MILDEVSNITGGMMFKNYFTIALRHLIRHKTYTLINVLGLAIGMTCVILIALFIQDELSYDTFHQNADRIYRVLRENHQENGTRVVKTGTSGGLGSALVRDFHEVEQYVHRMSSDNHLVQYGSKKFNQRFCFAKPSLLEIFSFPLIKGDPETVLNQSDAVILTQAMVDKFFGDEDPIGKTITVDDRYTGGQYTITGVFKNIPRNSSLQFDFIAAKPQTKIGAGFWRKDDWSPAGTYCPIITHIMLAPNASVKNLEQKLAAFAVKHLGEESGKRMTYHLQPLTEVHLRTTPDYGMVISAGRFVDPDLQNKGDIRYVYTFGAIAVFILLIACANFINLATARATIRVREVGMRKVVGALRHQLAGQFLGEFSLLALIALILSLVCVEFALPAFNAFTGKTLFMSINNIAIVGTALCSTLFVGLLAGSYPPLYLSAFQPAFALKGAQSSTENTWIRKGLVVFQFTLSILLIISTIVIHNQLTYISTKKLGMNKDQIVILPLRKHPDLINRWGLLTGHPLVETLRNELMQNPDVLNAATFSSFIYGEMITDVRPEGMTDMQMSMVKGNEHFLDTFDIKLVQGKGFEKDPHINERGWRNREIPMPFLLNETAVKQLGWTDPIGKQFQRRDYSGPVVGVVKDFHNRSLRQAVKPVFIMPSWKLNWFAVKIRTGNLPDAMRFIEQQWSKLVPVPFEYVFLNNKMDELYFSEKRIGQLASLFSLIAIFVACMGLWGLAAFTAERRTREIGIRKVLGASISQIVVLFSKEFALLVIIANIIAWPVAYYTMTNWLQGFAYRTNLGFDTFLLGGVMALIIALLTVSYQAFKSSTTNPTDALRHE